jgi:hypothetical protein
MQQRATLLIEHGAVGRRGGLELAADSPAIVRSRIGSRSCSERKPSYCFVKSVTSCPALVTMRMPPIASS